MKNYEKNIRKYEKVYCRFFYKKTDSYLGDNAFKF